MTGQIVLRSSSSLINNRRTPLLAGTPQSPANSTPPSSRNLKKSKSNVGELAGNTTADICVVCCCCPCVAVEFLILAVKLPANVVRRMWKNHRRKSKTTSQKSEVQHYYYSNQYRRKDDNYYMKEFEMVKVSIDGAAEAAVELDNRMWEQFKDAGFWRSPSQRLVE